MTGAGITRRRFVGDAGIAAVAATELIAGPALAAQPRRRHRKRRQTVAVFGGGIAGLTAAHELADRGFDVTVYERRAWGGKARSTEVPGSAAGGRRPLPGEHGFRAFFGAYQNVPDTMRRIPFGSNPNGVFDCLVEAPQISFARFAKPNMVLPVFSQDVRPFTAQQLIDAVVGVLVHNELPPVAAQHFGRRLAVFFSSCDARRLGQWEKTSWVRFIAADRFGDDYRKILGELPNFTQASKGEDTSAKYVGWLAEVWWIYALLGRGTTGPMVRVLNLPTSECWIDPWISLLRRLGVRFRLNHELTGLRVRRGEISRAYVRAPRGRYTVAADHYVCALPVERARRLWTREILAAAPELETLRHLRVAWYNGITYFLRERTQILEGHVLCSDSPWILAFLPQAQFWAGDFASRYGDGTVRDKIAISVADWDSPGIVYGRPARDCSPDELAKDCWEQMKRSVNKPGRKPVLTDDMLHSWEVDRGMLRRGDRLISEEPLILPTAGTEQYRPAPATSIPNLVLCGDYLDGSWETTNMDATSYNGRRAANVILARAGSRETPATVIEPYRPPEWEPLQKIDEQRYGRGEPNLFDAEPSDAGVAELIRTAGAAP